MGKKKLITSLVGVALLIAILSQIDVSTALSTISHANPWPIAGAVMLSLAVLPLKALRWHILLGTSNGGHGFGSTLIAYLSGTYLGLITPGRVGELSRALYLRGAKAAKVFPSVVVDRLLDFYILLPAAACGFLLLPQTKENPVTPIAVVGACLMVPLLALSRTGSAVLTALSGKMGGSIKDLVTQFYSGVRGITPPRLAAAIALTITTYALGFTQYYLLMLALDLSIPLFSLAVYMAVACLVVLLPLSIAGIGTRDAAIIALLSLHSISAETALGYSLLVLLVLQLPAIAVGATAWQARLRTQTHENIS